MSTDLVRADYHGYKVTFNEGAWFNATEAAAFYGKKPYEWLRLPETENYINALCNFYKAGKSHFIKTKRGKKVGGTWFHPRLAVPFARWCDVGFAIWCDDQIDRLLRGTHPHFNWKRVRHEATASDKVMHEVLRIVREAQGKATSKFHHSNEARLVNWALSGEFKGIEREALSEADLTLLARLEIKNSVMLGHGFSYQDRKAALKVYATETRHPLAIDRPVSEIWPEAKEAPGQAEKISGS